MVLNEVQKYKQDALWASLNENWKTIISDGLLTVALSDVSFRVGLYCCPNMINNVHINITNTRYISKTLIFKYAIKICMKIIKIVHTISKRLVRRIDFIPRTISRGLAEVHLKLLPVLSLVSWCCFIATNLQCMCIMSVQIPHLKMCGVETASDVCTNSGKMWNGWVLCDFIVTCMNAC